MHIHTYTNDYVLTSRSFFVSAARSDWAVLTGGLSPPAQRQDGSIAANCEIDGLQAVCVVELIEFPHQTPVVWTGACHNTHTHTDWPRHPHQVLCLYLNWQLPYYYFSYLSNRWGISLTCSALSLSLFRSLFFLFHFFSLCFRRCLTSCTRRRDLTQSWYCRVKRSIVTAALSHPVSGLYSLTNGRQNSTKITFLYQRNSPFIFLTSILLLIIVVVVIIVLIGLFTSPPGIIIIPWLC